MPTDAPDKANVIALPPLIVGAPWRWGLLLHFVWLIRFLARTDALWLGALLIVVSTPIVIGAARQLAKAKTAFDVRKPTTDIVTGGVFRISRNPTYLSMMLGFLGIASLIDSLWLLLLAPLLIVILEKASSSPKNAILNRHLEKNICAIRLGFVAGFRVTFDSHERRTRWLAKDDGGESPDPTQRSRWSPSCQRARLQGYLFAKGY